MPLSWNDIRERATEFAREWGAASSEHADAKTFWDEFFDVFGIKRRRVANFEHAVKKLNNRRGAIDLLWPGKLLVEHKSRGKSLDRAEAQAHDYFAGLAEHELPRYVLVSDFAYMRLEDLETREVTTFALYDLPKHIERFGFVAGYAARQIRPQDPVNVKAAERMGLLHDRLRSSGYLGHDLELLLVRLLFCLFADDTGIFPADSFRDWIEQRTAEDGSDLGMHLAELFQVLNTPDAKRQRTLDEQLRDFPYINGALFAEPMQIPAFDRAMRNALLEACALEWGGISPAIFGALFQSILDDKARRNLGAHYTSEENIHKLIGPLFLDDLKAELERIGKQRQRLIEFQSKLSQIRLFDPACGCGNFLVVAYRELRELELEVIRRLHGERAKNLELNAGDLSQVDVDQCYGMEIEEFPSLIAQVALWLTDHQANMALSREFGRLFVRIPLVKSATIVNGNALLLDWSSVLAPERCTYLLGNPPFVGAKYMDDAQRKEAVAAMTGVEKAGLLDYVAAWFVKAARYAEAGRERAAEGQPPLRCAFVSTNSICQGEQVGVLWGWLLSRGVQIHFAHRSFRWSNEARGVAAVHCIIVGFGLGPVAKKRLFDYESVEGVAHEREARNINPYLVDAPDVVLPRRSKPLCAMAPAIGIGNKPIDGGNYLFTTEERDAFVSKEPASAPLFRRWIGSDEFLNGWERWCLWLGETPPQVIKSMPQVLARVQAVRAFREASGSAPTKKLALTPTRFHVEFLPEEFYLVVPKTSSERRRIVPIGFESPTTLSGDAVFVTEAALPVHFGLLSSTMHNAWIRYTCGRLESRIRYSASVVYNNFPWPELTPASQKAIEEAGQRVLDARAQYPGSSLADLYDPDLMPAELVKAHAELDKVVDAAYGKRKFGGDAERVAFLFERYLGLVGPMAPVAVKAKRGRR